jgi:F5/8 type C domain-containing protein
VTRRPVLLASAAYLLLTLAYTWPLPLRLTASIPHDPGDPLLNAWIMWWTTQAVPLTARWWNAPIFYPAAGALAFSEHLLGLAPIAAPLIAISREPLLGYNVTLLSTFVLSALGAHFLAYTLTRRHDVAFVAGAAYAFAPYRLAQLPHVQVLASYWTPVCLAALHRYGENGRARWGALAAGGWLMQALCCGYYFFFLSTLLALWFLWFAAGRWSAARVLKLAGLWIAAALPLVPLLYGYQHILRDTYGFSRGLEEVGAFGADFAGLLHAPADSFVWGWLHVITRPESEIFPGLTMAILIVLAIRAPGAITVRETPDAPGMRVLRWTFAALFVALLVVTIVAMVHGPWRLSVAGLRLVSVARPDKPLMLAVLAAFGFLVTLPRMRSAVRGRSTLTFYLLAAFAMWFLALGPDPSLMTSRVLYQAPYGWLMRLPGFDGLRVPARFWMMTLVCLSAVAALGLDQLRGRARRPAIVLAAAGLLVDGWPGTFTLFPRPDVSAAPAGVSVRLNLPVTDDEDALSLYWQTHDGLPLENGFSGYAAPHYYAMREMLKAHDPRILAALATAGPVGVVIDRAADTDRAMQQFILSFPGVVTDQIRPAWSSYRIPGRQSAAPPERSGQPLRIKALTAFPSQPHTVRAVDGDLTTRWSGGVQTGQADFTIELEQATYVRQVIIELGPFMTDYAKRLRVDVSSDGSSWETVFLGDTALEAYYGAVRHPREIPIVLPIERDRVRFIRLQQTGWGTHDWSIAEISVTGR